MDDKIDAHEAQERRIMMTAVVVVFLVISWIAVALRTWVRGFMIRSFGWDDALMLLAAMTYSIYAGFNLFLTSAGFGNAHLLQESPKFIANVATYILAAYALYAATMVIFKISLGIFYLRIIVARWQKILLYVTVGASTVYGIFFFFMILFQCGSPNNFLRNALTDRCMGSRYDHFIVSMLAGVVNAVSDVILALLPISVVYKASMPRPAKISAGMILLLGCIGSAVSIVRLTYIHGLLLSDRFFEVGVDITIWSVIETGICITAASLATLRPLCASCLHSNRRLNSNDSHTQPMVSIDEIIHPDLEPGHPNRSKLSLVLGHHDSDKPLPTPRRLSATPKTHTLETLTPQTDTHITHKASIRNGKVQWRMDLPPDDERPAQPAWLISKQAAAGNASPPPIASYDTETVRGKDVRKPSLEEVDEPPPTPPSPSKKQVGVGAWRDDRNPWK
ncbi:hypothetical protein Q7P37_010396 [Cladosporium fusiforme]